MAIFEEQLSLCYLCRPCAAAALHASDAGHSLLTRSAIMPNEDSVTPPTCGVAITFGRAGWDRPLATVPARTHEIQLQQGDRTKLSIKRLSIDHTAASYIHRLGTRPQCLQLLHT